MRFVNGAGVALAGLAIAAMTLAPAMADPAATFRAPHLKPDLTSAEGGIWDMSDRQERYVRDSAERNQDPALTTYVQGVVCRLAADYCADLRVYVLDRPFLNAAAAANGYVEVNSGLLLRVTDEDQLAFVIGHEISHFARDHLLHRWQDEKNTSNAMLLISAGITVAAGAAMYGAARSGAPNAGQTINSISQTAQSLSNLTYLYGTAHLFAFSREQETEADRLGYDRARQAGYRTAAGVEMWTEVQEETRASTFARVREGEARASIFNTHPVTVERIAALRSLGANAGEAAPSLDAQHRYRAAIRPHLGEWLKDDLRRRDYGQTLYLIDRLKGEGEDLGLLDFYRGEVYRHRRADGDAALALSAYRTAVTHEDAPPQAWRELADACVKLADKGGARTAYQTYLDRAPKAQDRWLVEASLKSLEESATP